VRAVTDAKLKAICQSMNDRAVDVALITDFEKSRNAALRYLCGHPADAELLLFSDGHTALIPWDLELAGTLAQADEVLNVQDFDRSYRRARFHAMTSRLGMAFALEVMTNESYYEVGKIREEFPNVKIVCDPKGTGFAIAKARRVKERYEIEIIREGCHQTNKLIDMIQPFVESHPDCTEVELSLFLEMEMRKLGAEKPGFETLVANGTRSAQIHNYPTASTEPLAKQGLALIDFGLIWKGYTTDVTVPMVFGDLNPTQEKMIDMVQKVHDTAISRIKPGALAHEIATEAIETLEAAGLNMPYSLGHGIGLEVHEAPLLGMKPIDPGALKDWVETPLEEGMIFTIEPGCVDPDHGGTRLEDDVLVTATGVEVLTKSRLLKFRR
jgi:Xaa-Pro dipeptidase